jgi:hypothetical protein
MSKGDENGGSNEKATVKPIEAELYCDHDTLKEIHVMFCREEVDANVGGSRTSLPRKPP